MVVFCVLVLQTRLHLGGVVSCLPLGGVVCRLQLGGVVCRLQLGGVVCRLQLRGVVSRFTWSVVLREGGEEGVEEVVLDVAI